MSLLKRNANSKNSKGSRRGIIIAIVIVILLAIAGSVLYAFSSAETDAATAPALQTAKVRSGDLLVSSSGAGSVIPSADVDLGFRAGGVIAEVLVTAGEKVQTGQVLIRLDDSTQRLQLAQAEANLRALFAPEAIAQAQLATINAQATRNSAVYTLQYLISPDAWYWENELQKAETTLVDLQSDAKTSPDALALAQAALDRARANLKAAQYRYTTEYIPATFIVITYDTTTRIPTEIITIVPPNETDIATARAKASIAEQALKDTQAYEAVLLAGPSVLESPLFSVGGASMNKLDQARLAVENARLALENTRLAAPFDGNVVSMKAVVGQTVGTSSVLTLATLDQLLVRFYMDETDLAGVAVGNRTVYTFDAYPEVTLEGQVTMVESALQTVEGSPVVIVWGSLPERPSLTLLSGMSVDVEVIAGEAKNALLVPVQALRELSPGSYAVFIVQPDGTLVLTPVTVGLRDFANAEITSGLKAGDVVSTGTVETK
ncbi:MAG: efflux RND transporter periplasmic adaptor subunit [Chloroflexi bacterium]|nr:efflux RND transporter periplasmic adaptor subunit [Chloroflexota bacterium]